MNRVSRIVLALVAFLAILIIAAAAALVVTVRRPFPDVDGVTTLEGLEAAVDVYRDEYGVPHIYAENEHDLFFAQGYVHAQDRFWQMEFWRHTGQGRLSELVASDQLLENDKFIRTVGWNRMAEDALAHYQQEAPEYLQILEDYSAGVNAYLAEQGDAFSINQTILGLTGEPWEIEPWEPLDTISWAVVMSWDLGGNWSAERTRAHLNQMVGEATTTSLLPPYPFDRRPVIAPTDQLENRERLLEETQEESRVPQSVVDWSQVDTKVVGALPALALAAGSEALGSNNWVVSGEHTATGLPLLANDPHLGIQMPSIWYEVDLHAPGLNVAGFSFAGAPGVIIGHNERIAWGVTNVGPDVQDLYIEKINPVNSYQYEYEGEWQDMEVVEEIIKVNGGEEVPLEVRLTRHGPILNEVIDGENDVLALRWTMQEPSRLFRSVLMLNRAQDYEDFREALRYWDGPSQNFVYADVDGNIAYQTPGRIPIRENGDGLVPVPGWTGEYEWQGYIPYEDLPAMLNPEEGFIVTANNAVVDPQYPYAISYYWASGDRAQRIRDMLQAAIDRGDVEPADLARIQMDGYSLLAEDYIPLLDGLSSDDPSVQAAIERLRGWDLQLQRDSVPATIFEIFYMQLADAVLADELGPAREEYLNSGHPQLIFFHSLAGQPEARWWDDTTTEEVEGQDEMILTALERAVAWLEENVGDDVEDWRWGNLHTATFVSNPLGQSGISLIESMVNRGPFEVDGGSSTVNANSWSWDDPAVVRGHPSMRMILDLDNFDNSLAIQPTGQSGHPFHRHYDDFIEMWQNGEYHPLWFSQEVAVDAAQEHLVLQPPAAE